jgi:hypothetical protein
MRKVTIISLVAASLTTVAVAAAWFASARSQPGDLRVAVRFLGYTNDSDAARLGVFEVSNASPFSIVRSTTRIALESSTTKPLPLRAGLSLLLPGECEESEVDAPTNHTRWRLTVACEWHESAIEYRVRRTTEWLHQHGLPGQATGRPGRVGFSSDWIDP